MLHTWSSLKPDGKFGAVRTSKITTGLNKEKGPTGL